MQPLTNEQAFMRVLASEREIRAAVCEVAGLRGTLDAAETEFRSSNERGANVRLSSRHAWSSEDTQPYSFKVFFRSRLLLDCPNYLRTALMNVADLEAHGIVFATGRLAFRS